MSDTASLRHGYCFELQPPLENEFQDPDGFDRILGVRGRVYREVKNRKTLAITCGGERFFIKIHHAMRFREMLATLLKGHRPVTSARQEWKAIEHLDTASISTMEIAGKGERRLRPFAFESFLVTRALEGYLSLEELVPVMETLPDGRRARWRREFAAALGATVGAMHRSGMNHRDCYLCHFLVKDRDWLNAPVETVELHVIDLHRAQIRDSVPRRWLAKDLAGLHFSSLESDAKLSDYMRFLRSYLGRNWKAELRSNRRFWYRVALKSMGLKAKWEIRRKQGQRKE